MQLIICHISLDNSFSWKRFLRRLIVSLAASLIYLIIGLSFIYTYILLHPPCLPSANKQPGFESITLTLAGGMQLNGWWLPPKNGAVILLLGGHGSNRDAMLPEADMLAGHGYGVITLDYRQCAGKLATLGYREIEEMEAMVAFAKAQPDVDWLGVLGFSVGGTTAIRGAVHMPELQAVIAQGNYSSLSREVVASPSSPFSVKRLIQYLVALFYRLQVGVWPNQVCPLNDLPRLAPRPVLLIHGENEIDRTQGQIQLAAALSSGSKASLWVVPGTGHGGYLKSHPQDYEARVIEFLEKSRNNQT